MRGCFAATLICFEVMKYLSGSPSRKEEQLSTGEEGEEGEDEEFYCFVLSHKQMIGH